MNYSDRDNGVLSRTTIALGSLSGLAIAGDLLSRSLFSHLIVIHSLKDLYGSSIARDLLSRSLFSHLIAIRSFDPSLFTQLRDLLSRSLFIRLIVYSDAVEIRADFFDKL